MKGGYSCRWFMMHNNIAFVGLLWEILNDVLVVMTRGRYNFLFVLGIATSVRSRLRDLSSSRAWP